MEADPGTFDAGRLRAYMQGAGINRFSMGVQAFQQVGAWGGGLSAGCVCVLPAGCGLWAVPFRLGGRCHACNAAACSPCACACACAHVSMTWPHHPDPPGRQVRGVGGGSTASNGPSAFTGMIHKHARASNSSTHDRVTPRCNPCPRHVCHTYWTLHLISSDLTCHHLISIMLSGAADRMRPGTRPIRCVPRHRVHGCSGCEQLEPGPHEWSAWSHHGAVAALTAGGSQGTTQPRLSV